jgi:quercetin dioxygenase-like cupin family protein
VRAAEIFVQDRPLNPCVSAALGAEEWAMTQGETTTNLLDRDGVITDENLQGDYDFQKRQMLATKGWQVASIPANAKPKPGGGSYIKLTESRHAECVINVYPPGKRDEMHCHPGSEHIFLVFQGQLHVRGLNEGEDLVLNPGELVHIRASYYYQLANETDELAVLYQVATRPAKPPRISRYSYRGPNDIDPTTLEG